MSEPTAALERAEMEAWADVYRTAAPELVAACGLSLSQIADAIVVAANRIDVLALNRVMGLGLRRSPSERVLAEVVDALDRTGSPRCFVSVAPVDGYETLGAELERLGLRHYNNWMRLRRDVSGSAGPSPQQAVDAPQLDILRIGSEQAGVFGDIVATAFHYPPAVVPLVTHAIGRPHWHHYLAFEGQVPVATAAMYVAGEAAWFGFAATDEAHRRRGAQQALVRRRLADAANEGCRWVSVETAEDAVTRDAPSFRNLRRLGFEVAYRRANYLWTRPSA